MNVFQAILMGIIQGLTEFIPVSSTAHLLLAQRLLGIDPNDAWVFSFNVLVQLGTLLALLVYFWKDLWGILKALLIGIARRQPFADPQARMGWYLILATLPVIVIGYLLKPLVEMLFRTQALEATIRLAITAVLLFLVEFLSRPKRGLETMTGGDALGIGIAQILSIFPGASRSGSTIAGGMALGLQRAAAARFAFLLSVPTMIAAGAYEVFDLIKHQTLAGSFLPVIAIGFFVAAVVGYLAIRWLLNYLARRPLYIFAGYCALMAVFALILYLI